MIKLKFKDGDTVHGIKVLKFYDESDRRKCRFVCPKCGKEHSVFRGNILQGKVKSCGCFRHHKREWKPSKYEDLSGRVFGDLTVLERDLIRKDRVQFLCKCKCGKTKSIFSFYLTSGKSVTCGCSLYHMGQKSRSWKGCGKLSGHYFAHIRGQAKDRNIKMDVTIDYLWRRFEEQEGKCALTGVSLHLPQSNTDIRTASVDRIDNTKGYVHGNVQWVHKDVNLMKRTLTQEQFLTYCNLVAKRFPLNI